MHRPLAALLLTGILISLAHAEDKDPARWYRYYNEKNQPAITDRITEEHISRGYEALDQGMQVLRRVPPQRALTPEEVIAAKAARAADVRRKEDDKQLLRLYSRPRDAEQNRDRQIDAIQLRIDFTTSALSRLREARTKEAQRAAVLERTGKPIPDTMKADIAKYDKQIQQMQAEILARKAEQEKIRQDFTPVIQRLSELTGLPASTGKAATTTTPGASSQH